MGARVYAVTYSHTMLAPKLGFSEMEDNSCKLLRAAIVPCTNSGYQTLFSNFFSSAWEWGYAQERLSFFTLMRALIIGASGDTFAKSGP